jgi:HK97 gp10 family phage protein
VLSYKIEGLDRLIRKCEPELIAKPLRGFFNRAAIAIENRAKQNAPVDTGRLRASIGHEIDAAPVPHWAKVGTNVKYAPFMEFGTGLFAEGPGAKGGRHWPPGAALGVWAARHGGASGYAVAAAIGKRGGLKPRRYLRNAFRDAQSEIQRWLNELSKDIRAAWEKR